MHSARCAAVHSGHFNDVISEAIKVLRVVNHRSVDRLFFPARAGSWGAVAQSEVDSHVMPLEHPTNSDA